METHTSVLALMEGARESEDSFMHLMLLAEGPARFRRHGVPERGPASFLRTPSLMVMMTEMTMVLMR